MSLRILLADESSTIKKVIELALGDREVEVKPVNIGSDVLSVAKNFKPDIAFIDVLLQKRDGYEVCADLKNDPELKNTPVVLMWSSFMDLDTAKLKQAQPDEKLEKPFNAETLTTLIERLATPSSPTPSNEDQGENQSDDNPIADFLSMPPTAEEQPDKQQEASDDKADQELGSDWQMASLSEDVAQSTADSQEPKEDFAQVNLSEISQENNDSPEGFVINDETLGDFKIDIPAGMDEISGDLLDSPSLEEEPVSTTSSENNIDQIIQILRPEIEEKISALIQEKISEQARDLIEQTILKVVPDIAEKLIATELDRLLKDTEDQHL